MCSLAGWTGADGLGRKQRRRGYERARGWRPALCFLSLPETIVRLQHSPIFLLPGPLLPPTLATVLGVLAVSELPPRPPTYRPRPSTGDLCIVTALASRACMVRGVCS